MDAESEARPSAPAEDTTRSDDKEPKSPGRSEKSPPKEKALGFFKRTLFSGSQAAKSSKEGDGGSSSSGLSTHGGSAAGINMKSMSEMAVSSAITPTTFLAGQLSSFSIQQSRYMGVAPADSPTSEYASDTFPSLPESGYASMPSMSGLEKLEGEGQGEGVGEKGHDASDEEMEVDNVRKAPQVSVEEGVTSSTSVSSPKIDITEASSFLPARGGSGGGGGEIHQEVKHPQESSSCSPGGYEAHSPNSAPTSLVTSNILVSGSPSPSVIPTVGENIEVMTDGGGGRRTEQQQQQQQDGMLSKRTAAEVEEDDDAPSKKTPRLSSEAQSEFGKFSSYYSVEQDIVLHSGVLVKQHAPLCHHVGSGQGICMSCRFVLEVRISRCGGIFKYIPWAHLLGFQASIWGGGDRVAISMLC